MRAHIIAEHKAKTLARGFKAAGYKLVVDNPNPGADDVLVAWNRKHSSESQIRRYEKAGAKVIIAENGYIGRDNNGNKLIALAHNYHLGNGRWFIGDEPRHQNHNFEIKPWRAGGDHIVLLGQRGIGNSKRIEWYKEQQKKIQLLTRRLVRLRAHPGKDPTPLEPDIENAHAVITWSSSAAIHAMAFGVPAFHLMPGWIGEWASRFGIDELENPWLGDRVPMFHRIGWAQWTPEEIMSGEAIKTVMKI